ncbi:hypothetical protein DYI25_04740 [Mesobacillus boroniphilus]|uniref:Uncharacterized protein n=1 Tax=Mesobacillus boroniphilus TaxID=308892 RepID=A0A944CJR5_9BACI|nr:hypothetical protein [Mesobacillus boroniphilus]
MLQAVKARQSVLVLKVLVEFDYSFIRHLQFFKSMTNIYPKTQRGKKIDVQKGVKVKNRKVCNLFMDKFC